LDWLFLFVALVTGSSFHKVFLVCPFLGCESPAESTYCRTQRIVTNDLRRLAYESVERGARDNEA
jgi:hypothetical protein